MIWLLPWDTDHPSRHLPWATWTVMALNIAVWLLMPRHSAEAQQAFTVAWGLASDEFHGYQFVTSAFLHASWAHLIGNLFFLWVFGDNVEDALGTGGFLVVYLVGGLLGDLVYVAANDSSIPSVGASGCIAAIAGAYGVLFFTRRIALKIILVVVPIYTLRVPAWLLLGLFFGADLMMTFGGRGQLGEGGGTNYVVHGIGFLLGAGLAVLARVLGTMRRFETLPNGDPWWGYVLARLEEEHLRARMRQRKHARLVEEAKRS